MSTPPVLPVLNKDFFVADAIDFNMENNADQPFYTFVDFDDLTRAKSITHLELGRAAHRVAHLLRPNRGGIDGDVVAIIAQTDTVLYHAIVAGLLIAGCPFPISHRNSPEGIIHLLTETSCRRVLTTNTSLKTLIDSIQPRITNDALLSDLRIEELPSIASVYPNLAHESIVHPFERYPVAALRPSQDDICIYLHSSGSTGDPRPIPLTQRYWIQVSIPAELKKYRPRVVLGVMCMPPFHSFGIAVQLFLPIMGVLQAGVYPPNSALPNPLPPVVPSPDNVLEHMKYTRSNVLIAPPTFLQIWTLIPKAVEYLKTLEYTAYGGGPLAPKSGRLLVDAGVRLNAMYGVTESGVSTKLIPVVDKEDWEYMEFHKYLNIRWEDQGDGSFELQFLTCEQHRPMFKNLPDADGYATSDLWEPHPTKEGRLDDVIIHSSGEKTVPAPIEAVVASHPMVRGAVVFGRERDQPGILIEPDSAWEIDSHDHSQIAFRRNQLWSTIEEANDIAPGHSRIFKEMILYTSKGKPLPRAGKGTVMRKAALNLYEKEINEIYENVEASIRDTSSPVSWSVADIETWIYEQVVDLIATPVDVAIDLFQQGFDSLYATSLRLRIMNTLRLSKDPEHRQLVGKLSPNLVYSFPVVKDLAAWLASLLNKVDQPDVLLGHITAMEAMIAKYTSGFDGPPLTLSTHFNASSRITVLLTGSTGNLGSQILAVLLKDPRIAKVYAYNRLSGDDSETLQQRHARRFQDVGLDATLLRSEKLVFIAGNAADTNLGVDQDLWNLLRQTVNVIIHNAWRIDFNLSLISFQLNIQATRNLLDLLRSGPHPSSSRFLFISSIGAVQNWDKFKGVVPEDVLEDASIALGSGYGESKHIAERIVFKSGLQATSLRLGQISGGRPKGAWPTNEWLPILVKSSISLGILPTTPGSASWLGADTISATIVDVALSTPSLPLPKALNLVHPRPVQQDVAMRSIRKAIFEVLGHDLKLVGINDWLTMVEERAENATTETWTNIPAVKLLGFYRGYAQGAATTYTSGAQDEAGGLPSLSTEHVQRTSRFMRSDNLPQISDEDAKRWVSYWSDVGFLH